ncbi:hypothetical protein LDENG_00269550, partial [Lucifuga dentata]
MNLDPVFSADIQQPLMKQKRSPSMDQEESEPPHIKDEQEKIWASQKGENLQNVEEADINNSAFTLVTVKSEDDDEESVQSSQLHQSQTEENREVEHLAQSSAEQTETEAKGDQCNT